MELNEKRYVFVCGLQRSGTSVLARNITRLDDCTGFVNTGAIEDEGQYLQSVYPTNNELGGTGWYGFDPRAHLTERSKLLTPANVASLRRSWHSYWDDRKRICIEKTPANLIMTRFLQAAFPNSYFVVIRRHPVSVSMANQRWKKSMASLHMGFEHWLYCHELFNEDRRHLKHVYELRYEDYVRDAPKYHEEIAEFIGARLSSGQMEEVTDAHNQKYLQRWRELLQKSPFATYYRYIAKKYDPRFAPYGYSLLEQVARAEDDCKWDNGISAGIGSIYCLGADAHARLWRMRETTRGFTKRQIRRWVPDVLRKRTETPR